MWTKNDIPDLSGKTAVVTGANSGIGFEIAHALFEKGANVVIGSRNRDNGEKAIRELEKRGGKGNLHLEILNLANLSEVSQFAQNIGSRYDHIDILFNNAGVMVPPESKTDDGFEMQFGVNFLGHFTLTGQLYPLIKSGNGGRIVNLSSGAFKSVESVDYDNLRLEKAYNPYREYAVSKLANLQFMSHLQLLADSKGDAILSLGAHPGVTDTPLSRFMAKSDYDAALQQFGQLMPAWQGALPALYAGISKEVAGGEYFGPDGKDELRGYPAKAQITAAVTDQKQGALLWEYATQQTGISFP
ncbi:oxidoreductase [Pedobacter miscanthi]|uniref:Short-chain dehydrogenase n=1 Tax=Pedobacter miscanthi TaxID=2259170 RepID=A0A366KYT0_9SPHI|nr:oxidoreductase [Pedobacter miscanthi]RBQ06787.1 short-chain dehydrogenase [Pedobacter miscanthi]